MEDLSLLAGQAAQYGFPMVISWYLFGTHGRETGEPDPEHRTVAHGSENGIRKKRVSHKTCGTLFFCTKSTLTVKAPHGCLLLVWWSIGGSP